MRANVKNERGQARRQTSEQAFRGIAHRAMRAERRHWLTMIRRVRRSPLASFFTVLVVAVALALPATAFLVIQNLSALGASWTQSSSITVFLTRETSVEQARLLAQRLQTRSDVALIRAIAPDEALAEYAKWSGFEEIALELQGQNPLPNILLVTPADNSQDLLSTSSLVESLNSLQEVDSAQSDTEWVQRLVAIRGLLARLMLVASILIAIGVVVLVAHTVRLAVDARREEIEICALCGAGSGFISAPFLRQGVVLGLAAGVVAAVVLWLTIAGIEGPVADLGRAYGAVISVEGLRWAGFLSLTFGGAALGLIGSWLAVRWALAKHLAI